MSSSGKLVFRPYKRKRAAPKRVIQGKLFGIMPANTAVLGKPGRAVAGYVNRRRAMNVRTGGLLGIEKKFYDTFKAATAFASTSDWTGCEFDPAATISCLNAVTQGDGPTQRDGSSITMKSIFIQGACVRAAQEASVDPLIYDGVRIALVLDTQCRGAELNAEDVYGTALATALGAVSAPQRNMSYSTRFKVLREIFVSLNTDNISVTAANTFNCNGIMKRFQIKYVFPGGGLKVRYLVGGTTESIANITDNALFLIANSVSATCSGAYASRLRFVG